MLTHSLPPDGNHSTMIGQPAASAEAILEYLFPNYRDSTPYTVGGRGFETGTAKLASPADPIPRQLGSRIQMLPFTVTHSSLQNRAVLSILFSDERDIETK